MIETRELQAGDEFLLDGFSYELGEQVRRQDDRGATVLLRAFHRPTAPDEETAAAWKLNPNYKLSGLCREAELVWCEPHDLIDEVQSQAMALGRGAAGRLGMIRWADACRSVQVDFLNRRRAGAWTLPGRALIKPRPGARGAVLLPEVAAEAERLVLAALTSGVTLSKEG